MIHMYYLNFLLASIYLSCTCGESTWQRSLLQMALHRAHFHLKKSLQNWFSLTNCEQQQQTNCKSGILLHIKPTKNRRQFFDTFIQYYLQRQMIPNTLWSQEKCSNAYSIGELGLTFPLLLQLQRWNYLLKRMKQSCTNFRIDACLLSLSPIIIQYPKCLGYQDYQVVDGQHCKAAVKFFCVQWSYKGSRVQQLTSQDEQRDLSLRKCKSCLSIRDHCSVFDDKFQQ